jgi:carboxylesterase
LRGHGTHPDEMLGCRHTDWIADAEAGLTRLLARHERGVVVGLSMGGTLGLQLAARHADDPRVAGLVTISAPLTLTDWRLGAINLLSRVIKWQAWGKPDIKDRRAWDGHVAYRRASSSGKPGASQTSRTGGPGTAT